MMIRIPSAIPIMGHVITVTTYAASDWPHGDDCEGLWDPSVHQISLHGDLTGTKREQVFFHELTHAALTLMSHKLAYNEVFVDQFASLMHQALSGAKYPSNRKRKENGITISKSPPRS
jgi:hypothetical protein